MLWSTHLLMLVIMSCLCELIYLTICVFDLVQARSKLVIVLVLITITRPQEVFGVLRCVLLFAVS